MPVPYFSVCIITFRRPELLARCLERIAPGRQTLSPSEYEIVVSDDCPERSAREVVETVNGARWVEGPGKGVAANRNCVAQAARGEWIVFVDDDELAEPDWLEQLHKAARTERWEVIAGRVEPVNCPDSIFWYAPTLRGGGIFGAGNLAIRREVLIRLGGFDERLRVSHEDMELGRRIQVAGLATTFLAEAKVWHPARRLTLGQVWRRATQQQCQTYQLEHGEYESGSLRLACLLGMLPWGVRYWYRCLKIEIAVHGWGSWRRLVIGCLVRALVCPFALAESRAARLPRESGTTPSELC